MPLLRRVKAEPSAETHRSTQTRQTDLFTARNLPNMLYSLSKYPVALRCSVATAVLMFCLDSDAKLTQLCTTSGHVVLI